MYIPASQWTADPAISTVLLQDSSDGVKNGGWSSLIGVVTAIVGNVLISLALNTQRYAHIRMSRDREARQQEKRKSARRQRNSAEYGTQHREVAEEEGEEERAEQNGKAKSSGQALEQQQEGANETHPLIPKLDSRQASASASASSSGELGPDDEKDEDGEDVEEKSYLRSPIWWLGIAMMVVGETGNFLAYGFAPASIVSPLGVVALVSNCLIAPLLLKETFRIRDGVGVLLAIGGAVVVVLSARDSNPKLTPGAIWGLVTAWEFETYLGVTALLIAALTVLSNLEYGQKSILIDLGLVGLYGGYTALSTKGVASLLTYSLYKVVTFPITYLLVTVLVFTAVMQIKYVNRALQTFNSTMVIPTQFVMFTISVIIGSAVLYRDFERESPEDAGKFVGGCALTFFGVWCITSGRKCEPHDGSEHDAEETTSLSDEERAVVMPEVREHDGPSRNTSLVATALTTRSLSRAQTAEVGSLPGVHVRAPTLGSTPPCALDWNRYLPTVQPGTASAVHRDSARLHGRDHADSTKPVMHATTSAPIIPQTPLTRTSSGPADRPSPHRSPLKRAPTVEPPGPHRLLERTSSLRLGPLTSPLSGSLAAIVADELRRGIDKSPRGSIRRRTSHRPTQGRRPTGQDEDRRPLMSSSQKRHSIASTDVDFHSHEAADLRTAAGSPPGRFRSLSATMSEMFGSSSGSTLKRQRTLERDRKKGAESAVVEQDSSRQNGGR